jgi:hypothetical protein
MVDAEIEEVEAEVGVEVEVDAVGRSDCKGKVGVAGS